MRDFMNYFAANYTEVATQYTHTALFNEASPKSAVDRVLNSVLSMDSTVAVAVIDELTWSSEREAALLGKLPLKLYLLNSSESPTDTIALSRLCRSGFRLVDVGPTGHYPMIEAPLAFNQALGKVLREISQSK